MPSSKDFLDDPVGFARVHALLPSLGQQPPSELKAKIVDPNLTVHQVKGGNRVLFACINRHVTQTNLYEVDFNPAQATSDWFPVYWLPWKEDHVYRITLRQSKKHHVTGLGDKLVSPNLFFTAALNGCLVHVDGDPWEPTVYHLNAKAYPVPKAPSTHTQGEWNFLTRAERMMTQADTAHRQLPKGPSHYRAQSVNAFQYMGQNARDDAMEEQQSKAAKELGTTFKEVTPINLGIVFGVRGGSTGLWSFYYQSITHYLYTKEGMRFDQWVVNRCERFWPGSDITKPIPITFAD